MLQEIRLIQHFCGQGSENLFFLNFKMHFLKNGNTIKKKKPKHFDTPKPKYFDPHEIIFSLPNYLQYFKIWEPFCAS